MQRACLTTAVIAGLLSVAVGQQKAGPARWEEQIRRFEAADRDSPPEPGGVVFVGSSSIRMWDTARWFPHQRTLNRGFGGSEIADVNWFAERIVVKYRPRTIVFYAGDNDVARGKSAGQVFDDFKAFADLIARRLPNAHVVYLPIKPSLARWQLWPQMREANRMIEQLVARRDHFYYADTASPMLGADGKPRAELFRQDGLHLNDKGYELWTGIVRPILEAATARQDAASE